MDDVSTLVGLAAKGDAQAWAALVDRYASLVWVIARNHGLDNVDAADVSQTVWLKLAEHLDRISDPRRLPGWLSTTARRECLRVSRASARENPLPPGDWMERADGPPPPQPEVEALAAERDVALCAALSDLDPRCRFLLRLVAQGSPLTYQEMSQALDMPVGSIGPTRRRCLEKLRTVMAARGITDDGFRSV